MSKLLVEIFNYYGKNDGEELIHSTVLEEEKIEDLHKIVKDYAWEEPPLDEVEEVIKNKSGYVNLILSGGDWDDPTSRCIVVSTYEKKKQQLEDEFNKKMEKLNKLFGFN